MNSKWQRCATDVGWIQVLVGTGACSYEKPNGYSSLTLVSFIPNSVAGLWENSEGKYKIKTFNTNNICLNNIRNN